MRKSLFVGVLATLLVVVSMFPFFKSGATNPDKTNAPGIGRRLPPGPLPNYDIRLEGDGQFADYDLSSPGRQAECSGTRRALRLLTSFVRTSDRNIQPTFARRLTKPAR